MDNFHSLPITIPRSKKQTLIKKSIFTLIFYFGLFLLIRTDWINAQTELLKRGKAEIGGASTSILAAIIFVGATFFLDREFRRFLFGKVGLVYLALVFFYAFIGWLLGNTTDFLRRDLLSLLWLIGGLAIFRLIVKSYYPQIQLLAFIFFSTFLVHFSLSMQIEILKKDSVGLTERVTDLIAFNYAALLLIPTGIALCLLIRYNLFWAIPIAGLVLIHIYCLGFLAATRSSVIAILTVLIFSLLSLCYKASNGILEAKSSILRQKWLTPILIAISIFLILAIFYEGFGLEERLQNTLIFERFFQGDAVVQKSTNYRIKEAETALESLQGLDIIFGKGLGSSFVSPKGDRINFTHIGILTFWLKGGFIVFILCVFFLYIRLPQLFVRSILRPYKLAPKERTAILTVLPGVFGWMVLLLMSGGFSLYNFIGVGFGLGAYLHFRKHGLNLEINHH